MKAYRFRAYPNTKQIKQFKQTAGCCRFVYNYFLDQKTKYYEENGKGLSYTKCSKMLTELKQSDDHIWLNDAESTALIQSLRDLEKAYKNFFSNPKQYKFPKFKSKKNNNYKYRSEFVDNNIRFEDGKLRIAKFGYLKVKNGSYPKGRIINTTVEITKTGKCFITLCCEEDIKFKKRKKDKKSGFDCGIKDFLVSNDGNKFNLPDEYFRIEKLIQREQRKLSRKELANIKSYKKVKGKDGKVYLKPNYKKPLLECKNYQKQRIKLAKLYERRDNIKNDFFNKLSIKICSENQTVFFEDLNIKAMIKNHKLAKSISNASWNLFMLKLQTQALKYGTEIIKIGRFYPSSQLCNACGYKKIDLVIKDRSWTCPTCNTYHDRDINAAINILNEGLRILTVRHTELACGDDVRLPDNLLSKAVVNEAGSGLTFALG